MRKKISLFEARMEILGAMLYAGGISPAEHHGWLNYLLEHDSRARVEPADTPLGKYGVTRCCCGRITSDGDVCHKRVILQSKFN